MNTALVINRIFRGLATVGKKFTCQATREGHKCVASCMKDPDAALLSRKSQ